MDHTLGEDEVGVKQRLANSQALLSSLERLIHSARTYHVLLPRYDGAQTDRDPTTLHIVEERTETVEILAVQCEKL